MERIGKNRLLTLIKRNRKVRVTFRNYGENYSVIGRIKKHPSTNKIYIEGNAFNEESPIKNFSKMAVIIQEGMIIHYDINNSSADSRRELKIKGYEIGNLEYI